MTNKGFSSQPGPRAVSPGVAEGAREDMGAERFRPPPTAAGGPGEVNILTLDFETFFSDEYTLKEMTTEAYVRDPRFEALGCGLKAHGQIECGRHVGRGNDEVWDYVPPGGMWVSGFHLKEFFAGVNWDNTAVLCHHAHFDCLILSHHYGIKPRFIYDTLSMARLQLGNHISVGLESLARHYGLQGKSVPYEKFRGKRATDIAPDLWRELGDGCLHDVELTWQIFCKLMRGERS